MLSELFIALLASFQLWLAPAAPAQQARVAQAAPVRAASVADRAAGRVYSLQNQRRGAVAEKQALARTHRAQLAEVDRLKKRRASWRRDRQLKKALADSQQTAALLSVVDRRIRVLDRELAAAQRKLHAAARAELDAGAGGARATRLRAWVASSRRSLHRQRKIVLPDDAIDPLADPEDLEYQAQRIAQSERELERELRAMTTRATRYQRMARLRNKANRAATLERLDDDRPRRTTGRIGDPGDGRTTGSGGGASEDAADPASPSPGGPGPSSDSPDDGFGGGSSDSDPVVVLADVVDSGTLSALRRAESSGDPAIKAAAARRALKDVRKQLERLRQARSRIEKRARSLKKR